MKLKKEIITDYVDAETGEAVNLVTTKEYSTRVTSDQFYMMFIEYIAPLYKVKSDNAKKILNWLCCYAEYNSGKVSLTTKSRQQMSEEIVIYSNTITNNLAILKKAKLISEKREIFKLIPKFSGKVILK